MQSTASSTRLGADVVLTAITAGIQGQVREVVLDAVEWTDRRQTRKHGLGSMTNTNPDHYKTDDGIECIDALRAMLGRERFERFYARETS